MRLKKTKALRYVVATFLTMGTILSVGFLSFSGLWIIYPYIIPAILAFFLSGAIEGKVFGISIFKGLARLKLLTSNAQKHLLFSELNKFLSKKDEIEIASQCTFLQDYWNQRKKYKALKNNPSANEEDIKEAKKRLEELKNYFYQQINISNDANNENHYISQVIKDVSLIELKSAKRSVWFLRFFWIISILVGIVSGFVTAFAVQEAITVGLALSLSVTTISAIVWPVAIFAAIGATFLLYYAITDIVKNDAIEKAFSKTLQLFKRKDIDNHKEPLGTYLLRLLSLSIVVVGITSLTVFATAASGGTCWIVMQNGIKLLAPKLPIFVAYCASAILIPINFVTDLIYGFSTTLQTIANCKSIFIAIFEGIKHPIKAFKSFYSNILSNLKKVKREETWVQFFNPFRILAKLIISPLQSLVFIGHLISIGFTTDRFLNVPPPLVAGVCAVSEGLQDLSFLTTEDDHHHTQQDHEGEDDHDHGNLLQLPLQVLLSPLLLSGGIFYWFCKKFGNNIGFFEALENTFELPLLNIVFFPLLLPSAFWNWTFKKAENNLTFFESIKKSFDIHAHEHNSPDQPETPKELSAKWREEERVDWILTTAEKRLNGVWIDKSNATEKQNKLKLLTSHREKLINYFKEKQQQQSTISFQEAMGMYFKENTSKESLGNGLIKFSNRTSKSKEFINNRLEKKQVENGHCNGNVPIRQDSVSTIFNNPRTIFFKGESKETTTSRSVSEAFCLVNAAAG
ncbi:hypothetical protein A1D18_05895 [Candidatus Rickettsiella isopodorum]|jgi:hypothetical protein|uniref:Uncharacterized protein n=1 Tax=Candidatus Rickettsiella isopodorum TaxID=1225476 RepID=A0A1J8NGC5_9COXI|nr:hypothetical protein [Candidatus Rickettsiella isopodorum]OIZ94369.1 hypothetical protein A1D18_05895 [Candidatus Rickettsiella isopodorum]